MGLPVGPHYAEQANAELAANLEGQLFLIHGDMDENVHISSTLTLVDALVAADKDFDLLILPNRSHSIQDDPYVTRVRWDYFVRHLLGATPPSYRIEGPDTQNAGSTAAKLMPEQPKIAPVQTVREGRGSSDPYDIHTWPRRSSRHGLTVDP